MSVWYNVAGAALCPILSETHQRNMFNWLFTPDRRVGLTWLQAGLVLLSLNACVSQASARADSLNGALSSQPDPLLTPNQHFDRGLQAYAGGDYASAAHHFRAVLAADPGNSNATACDMLREQGTLSLELARRYGD